MTTTAQQVGVKRAGTALIVPSALVPLWRGKACLHVSSQSW